MDPAVLALMRLGDGLDATSYKRIELVRTAMWRDLLPILAEHEALLCPTCAQVAPAADGLDDDYVATLPDGRFAGLDMCAPFNMVPTLPAISLPAGVDPAGLPIGLQVVGRRYADEALLALSAAIERALARAA
jgi:amidase/aspartyl-tRNA(Asn)/glutamyl-tRNA(Gln) amidotransferase subunit A